MSIITGSLRVSWEPTMMIDTTSSSYWLNWKFFLCTLWVILPLVFSSFLISKYEKPRNFDSDVREYEEPAGIVYEDEIWKPCIESVHPVWLLAYRIIAFFVLSILLRVNVAVDGGSIFYFYTRWNLTMITIYFGIGSLFSLYGCYQYHINENSNRIGNDGFDTEKVTVLIPNASNVNKSDSNNNHNVRKVAGFWGYFFQIIFQMNAGAVMLTDCVFWFFIVPFLTSKDYNLNFLMIEMHTLNVVFLLGDTTLNCLKFPWFRIAYFFLWTIGYVVFQWILHASNFIWWPYPFLDLASSSAPLWYLAVAIMHIPCFSFFVLVIKLKHFLLSKWFPHSYRCAK